MPDAHELELERVWVEKVPRDYREADLSELDVDVRPHIEHWLAKLGDTPDDGRLRGPNLLLFGPVGAGKTHAGFAAMRRLWFDGVVSQANYANGRSLGRNFGYWSLPDLLSRLRNRELNMSELLAVQVLFLDDVGTTKRTDWMQEQLFNILNARRAEVAPVVSTTNLDMESLSDHLGEPAFSRLVGDSHMVHVKGANRRRQPRPLQLIEP